jgi:hypothetical protein
MLFENVSPRFLANLSLVERIPCSVTVLIVDFIANNRKPLALTILWPAENASELLGPS